MDPSIIEKRRVYVGGLFPEVQSTDLREKFGRFGSVDDVQIKIRRDEKGSPVKTFAYLTINGHKKDFDKCFSALNRAKWKGSMLVLQNAKENFLDRLEKERAEAVQPESPGVEDRTPSLHDPLSQVPGVKDFVMRGAVPGTPIPGEKNWVVGKYGRVLPIVHLKKSNKKKIVRVDPSKLCHNLKKLKDADDRTDASVDTLTWDISDRDSEITKKRKGEFPESCQKLKSIKSDSKTQMVMEFLAERKRRDAEIIKEANNFEIVQHDGTVRKNVITAQLSKASADRKGSKKGIKSFASKETSDLDRDSDDTDEIIAATKVSAKKKSSVNHMVAPKETSDLDRDSADTDEIIASTRMSAKKKSNISHKASQKFQESFSESSSGSDSEGDVEASFVYVPGKKAASKKNPKSIASMKAASSDSDFDSADTDDIIAVSRTSDKNNYNDKPKASWKVQENFLEASSDSDSSSDSGSVEASSFVYIPGKKVTKKSMKSMASNQTVSSDSVQDSDDADEIMSSKKSLNDGYKVSQNLKEKFSETSSDNDSDSSDIEASSFVYIPGKKASVKKCLEMNSDSSDSDESELVTDSAKKLQNNDSLFQNAGKVSKKRGTEVVTNMTDSESSSSDNFNELRRKKTMSDTDSNSDSDSSSDKSEIELKSKNNVVVSSSKKSNPVSLVDKNKKETSEKIVPTPDIKVKNKGSNVKQKGKNFMSQIPEFRGRSLLDQSDENTKPIPGQKHGTSDTKSPVDSKVKKLDRSSSKTSQKKLDKTVSKCPDSEDSDSADSADTDEIVSNFRTSKNVPVSKSSPVVAATDEDHVTESDSSQDNFHSNQLQKSKKPLKAKTSVGDGIKPEKGSTSLIASVFMDTQEKDNSKRRKDKMTLKEEKQAVVGVKKFGQKDLSPLDKHTDDNRRRLETLQERKREIQNKKALVQQALAQVDSGTRLNKKIVFDSDDEVEEDNNLTTTSPASAIKPSPKSSVSSSSKAKLSQAMHSSSSDDDDDSVEGDTKEESTKKKKQLALFDSSDSEGQDSDIADSEKMFRIRPQYAGDKGKKLMELQSRYGNDNRFRMDERFVESEDDEEDNTKDITAEVEEGESERSRSLRILEDVVGRQPVARLLKQESQRKTFKDTNALHFDPSRDEHSRFEIKAPVKEKVSKKKNKKSVVIEEPVEMEAVPEVSKVRSYEVSSTIQETFKKSQEETSSGFSLLAAFGKKDVKSKTDSTPVAIATPSVSMTPWDNRFSVDSSDVSSDEEDGSQQIMEQQTTVEETATVIPPRKSTFFFLDEDDIRLKEGTYYFKRPEDFETVVEKWREQRPKLLESYKEKLRKAVKNKRKLQQEKNPVKRFGQHGTGRHRKDNR